MDFQNIAAHGLNTVRIPVPYFIFGDREPYSGCIEYLDKAFDWAGKYGLKILIDLHTAPGGQNSYDNGGLEGVCKWSQQPDEVEFVLTVLERLAMRYRDREELFGIEVLKELRTFSELPVIMLTAVTDEETQVQTFDNLADDYICKPFSLILLLKRIEALLRARYKTENTWKYKDAVVDFSGYRATYLGKDAAVTPKEIKLLAVLLENAGQVVSRDQILDRIWGEEESPFDRVVDVYVKNLRKKLQLDCIITVKGVGYRLELP